jgi:hypothetical protein
VPMLCLCLSRLYWCGSSYFVRVEPDGKGGAFVPALETVEDSEMGSWRPASWNPARRIRVAAFSLTSSMQDYDLAAGLQTVPGMGVSDRVLTRASERRRSSSIRVVAAGG